jgi:hypothetical protein
MGGVRLVPLLPVLLVVAFVAAGCGSHRLAVAAIRAAARPTPTERQWLDEVGRAKAEHGSRRGLERAVAAGGGALVRLSFEGAAGRAPDLVVATAKPASYLKHGLARVVHAVPKSSGLYVEVVDRRGRRVLEWTLGGAGGSLFVEPGLERCSPVAAFGWPPNLPACPSR